jgi:exosortase E/protease (VPEID-CTERM system)
MAGLGLRLALEWAWRKREAARRRAGANEKWITLFAGGNLPPRGRSYTACMDMQVKSGAVFKPRVPTLQMRLALLAGLFVLEKFCLNFLVDFDAAQAAQGAGAFVKLAQHDVFRFLVTLGIALAVFAYVRPPRQPGRFQAQLQSAPQSRWLAAHAALFLPLMPLSYALYRDWQPHVPFVLLAGLWLLFASLAMAAAFRAMAQWRVWVQAAGSLGELWVYACIAAAAATAAMHWVQSLWKPTAQLTFHLVNGLLLPLIPALEADPAELTLWTGRFAVKIADQCSGLEGLGLMLVFASSWLLLFRREYRFPRALLLIPLGLLLVFALNVLRLAVLILIGHSGHPGIAIYGFHSQAGWIAFNCAAVGVVLASRRIAWLNRRAAAGDGGSGKDAAGSADHVQLEDQGKSSNPTAAYLGPFLAVLIAGTLAHTLSSGFEFLYPLRFVAGLAALLFYRKQLCDLKFGCTWRGPFVGAVAFALWMAAAHYLLQPADMPEALKSTPPAWRDAWIVCRAAAAILTVPAVEELAYRGFLMRRWLGAQFESIPFAAVRVPQLLLTSLLFGAAHGSMWLPGTLAGVLYGAVLIRTGRIGEAIAAHATTNALVALCVVVGSQWQLW